MSVIESVEKGSNWMRINFEERLSEVYVSYCYKKKWYSRKEFAVIYYVGHLSLFKDFMKEQYVISSIDIMQLNYFKEDL
jgi:hypothetical protein